MDNSQISLAVSVFKNYEVAIVFILLAIIFLFLAILFKSQIKMFKIEDSIKEFEQGTDVQRVAASQLKILNGFYDNVLLQSRTSFVFALITAVFGVLFVIAAVTFFLLYNLQSLAQISIVGGVISSFFSSVGFYLYNKSSPQLADFHRSLDMTQRFLLADTICNSIKDVHKQDETRSDLIMTIAGLNSSRNPIIENKQSTQGDAL